MFKIKIKMEAVGFFGDSYKYKTTTLDKLLETTSAINLEEADYKNVIQTMISLVNEAKKLYPDEMTEVIKHDDNRLEGINFAIHLLNQNDEIIDSYDEKSFFTNLAGYESMADYILDYCKVTDDGDEGTRIRMIDEYDEGPPAGTYGILALVMQDKKWIIHYIDFLRTNDLDHEVEQLWDIKSIIDTYGWCNETMKLAAARLLSCCGQGGRQQFDRFIESGLRDHLHVNENRQFFIQDILGEFSYLNSIERGKNLLKDTKEYYLKQRTPQIDRLKVILTDDELKIIQNSIVDAWDNFRRSE